MAVGEIRAWQEKSLKEFRKQSVSNPEMAKKKARENLLAAKIITSNGRIARHYSS